MSRKEIQTEIEIEAPPERVWEVLTDFSTYLEWNTFMRPVVGEAKVGSRLRVQIRPPGGRAMAFRPKVTKVVPGRELRWKGRLWFSGLFDGEHTFVIETIGPDRVRFVQREVFTGLLVRFRARDLDEHVLPGFQEMNRALKERAEAP